jgi:FAD/FMN-containing dehydrogenase
MRDWAMRSGLMGLGGRKAGGEDVIQDVEIPIGAAPEFLRFLQREIGLLPVWLCPTRAPDPSADFVLYRTDPDTLYVNFGFWGRVRSDHPPGHLNRLVEKKVQALAGKKSLYSSSYFPEEEFWQIYNRPAYAQLKLVYDPTARLGDLYRKCVGGLR